jgi:hypothetical protein
MKRSESQSLYSALPGCCITYTSSANDGIFGKNADKKILRIGYWKSRKINKNDIYYPKIISQIIPDLISFYSEDNDKVDIGGGLKNLVNNPEYRERVEFLEIDPTIEDTQICGYIFPRLFYCPQCGTIKFIKTNDRKYVESKDIINMRCDCNGKGKAMNQYNRAWICSCGEIYSFDEYQVDTNEMKYFAHIQDGFVNKKGDIIKVPSKKCKCGNICTLVNATDPKTFYPRIITTIKLTENEEAKLCSIDEGRELIVDRHVEKISQDEFKERADKIIKNDYKIEEKNDDDIFGMLNDLIKSDDIKNNSDEDVLYRLLEYNTIKRKMLSNHIKTIEFLKEKNQINDENEIYSIINKLKIKEIGSVSDIEIINTAYGYTRKYQAVDEMRTDRKEPLVLRAFGSNNMGVPAFYNIRTETEGIIIDIDKRAIYDYLKNTYKQFVFKDLNDEELSRWFLEKMYNDSHLIKKFEEIELENGNMTNIYTKCIYNILHTISHMFINTLSKYCGMDKSSLGEIIFLNACSIFIYCKSNEGAVLGALTQSFDKNLHKILKDVYRDNEVCAFDPLCMNTTNGSCCVCTYLDEIACEHFNKDLSRRYLYGYKSSDGKNNILNFWEEV